jgi:putative membrane protein
MISNFNAPQRQNKLGVLVLFLDTIRQFSRALFPIILVSLIKIKSVDLVFIVLTVFFILVIFGSIAYLKYYNFTFFLDQENNEFIINEGILTKTKTAIQLHKIQNVNIKQSFIQKLIGIYSIEVDTAGTNNQEISIKAISHVTALDLKSKLLENDVLKASVIDETSGSDSEIVTAPENAFVKISFSSLLKIGITSNYIRSFFILLAFFFSAFENIRQIFGEKTIDKRKIDGFIENNLMVDAIPILIVLFLSVIIIVNLVRIIFRYYDYKITNQNGSLLLSFGLLNTKTTILKPSKVQIVSFSSNYFQKKMNVLEFKIKQATSGEKEEEKAAIEIPGCNNAEKEAILKIIFGKNPVKGIELRPNFRKLGFSIFITIILPFLFYLLIKNNIKETVIANGLVLIYIIFVGLIEYFKFKNNKLFLHKEYIIKQSGAWDIKNEIIETSKIQGISTSQLFWHKNLNIGSIILHTAGGKIDFQLGNFDKIKAFKNLWLYEIESSNVNWM